MNKATLEDYFLSTKGCINRKTFLLYISCCLLLGIILSVPYLIIIISVADQNLIDTISVIFSILMQLALLPSLFLSAKRLHDLNKPSSWIILYVIPLINILFFLYLCIAKSKKDNNIYIHSNMNDD